MTEKHFHYEGSASIKISEMPVEILNVQFLTPAKIKLRQGALTKTEMVGVDIVNRKVFGANGNELMSTEVFAFLDKANSLPDDFFAAPDHVHEAAMEAEQERKKMNNNLGDVNE